MNSDPDLSAELGSFRDMRRKLEASVLPLATSVDGRRFSFQASLHGLGFRLGGYVVVGEPGGTRLCQVLTLELGTQRGVELSLPPHAQDASQVRTEVPVRFAQGQGIIVEGDPAPFHDAPIRVASETEVRSWLRRTARPAAKLPLGEFTLAAGVACAAESDGFNRHTFLCGQSGSGKTYSLGVILERLLAETDLRLVVLDPNSDFVRLNEVRPGTDPAVAQRYARAAHRVAVYSADAPGPRRLRLHASEIDAATQAALLRLDPVDDREEYAALAALLADSGALTLDVLTASERPEVQRLSLRVRNLGVDRFSVWAPGEAGSVLDAIHDQDIRCVVVDLGSLPAREEQALVAGAVLNDLWRHRRERRPVLIVIDEAHNVCPAEPDDPLIAIAAGRAVQIAAEGRKFGLYLLVSTQRPQKIPQNVLTQADNLVLLRLNSLADAAFAQDAFSFVPPSLIGSSVTFRQGEALIAGKIAPRPAFLRFGARITEEGGADVPTTWATLRG